jgi:transcriptional regulator with XRE-family HTH domain
MGNDLIREARRRVGWTQAQLAERAGTAQSAIARLEAGGTAVSFDDVIRLLRLMGMDLDVMLVPRDNSDWVQARRLLKLDTEERHDALVAWKATADAMRRQYQQSVS